MQFLHCIYKRFAARIEPGEHKTNLQEINCQAPNASSVSADKNTHLLHNKNEATTENIMILKRKRPNVFIECNQKNQFQGESDHRPKTRG
jgi:hypothetical protein